jgi:putative hydrolase of the HAD superfamily
MVKPSCLLFDLDNTLTNRSLSISVFSVRFSQHFAAYFADDVSTDDIEPIIQFGDGGGYKPKEQMFVEIVEKIAWKIPPQVSEIRDFWYRVSPLCMQVRDGVHETLTYLKRNGYKLGIISNGQTSVQNVTIDAIDIRPFMGTIIVSETVGLRKPDPQIFALAMSELGASADETWYVGDHPTVDVLGAAAAGLTPIWFKGVHAWLEDRPFPELQIESIPEILELLKD